ncbi:MAG: tRNA (adenosine(37)-N6)-threonylcarbamoyltransferase complex ATPase subunit type 1 TsaE [Proteobacteria bacterium]|nr:tRNA (adenosine(37)-N6)-threonylcarbamoyltransferase complex ATPase subunit type 1 TsaE [Pseudomonadota bacterium]
MITLVHIDDLPSYAQSVAAGIEKHSPFCVWLIGELGSGKTAFARQMLYALGTPQDIAIASPTFSLMHSYPTPQGMVAHLDLYRLKDHDMSSLFLDDQVYAGFMIEWPTRAQNHPLIQPTHSLHISYVSEHQRRYVWKHHQ